MSKAEIIPENELQEINEIDCLTQEIALICVLEGVEL